MEEKTKERAEEDAMRYAVRDLGDAIQNQNGVIKKQNKIQKKHRESLDTQNRLLKGALILGLVWSLIAAYYITRLDGMNAVTNLLAAL